MDKLQQEKRRKKIGEAYAIITSKGYALAQVSEVQSMHGLYYCRIFNKLYKETPKNVQEILNTKEDYCIHCEVPSMTNWRYKMAVKLGMFSLPPTYKTPEYLRANFSFGNGNETAPLKYWSVRPYIFENNDIGVDEWVANTLKKNIYDDSWKEEFVRLNLAYYTNGKSLIENLENGVTLKNYTPRDLHLDCRDLWISYKG